MVFVAAPCARKSRGLRSTNRARVPRGDKRTATATALPNRFSFAAARRASQSCPAASVRNQSSISPSQCALCRHVLGTRGHPNVNPKPNLVTRFKSPVIQWPEPNRFTPFSNRFSLQFSTSAKPRERQIRKREEKQIFCWCAPSEPCGEIVKAEYFLEPESSTPRCSFSTQVLDSIVTSRNG